MEQHDARIREKMAQRAKDGELPCAVAFELAGELDVAPQTIGACADEMSLRLVKCQLGLFGYTPEKRSSNRATRFPVICARPLKKAWKTGAFRAARHLQSPGSSICGKWTSAVRVKPWRSRSSPASWALFKTGRQPAGLQPDWKRLQNSIEGPTGSAAGLLYRRNGLTRFSWPMLVAGPWPV
jgi:hypothetical protein